MNIIEVIGRNEESYQTGSLNFDNLKKRIAKYESPPYCGDEQVWTTLLAAGYADLGKNSIEAFYRVIQEKLNVSLKMPEEPNIWQEMLPLPPRKNEGNTNLDLVIGWVKNRNSGNQETKGGIELLPDDESWVAFFEMKWHSDISKSVSHSLVRNQLARVAENAVCFQSGGKLVKTPIVILVTPEYYKKNEKSRFYSYKFREYTLDPKNLLGDWKQCKLENYDKNGFVYPTNPANNIEAIVKDRLKFLWLSFEELFAAMPESSAKEAILEFQEKHKKQFGD